jgi:predicted amidohydrolase YtcJ
MGELPADVDGGIIVRDADGKPTGNRYRYIIHVNLIDICLGIMVDNAMTLIPKPPWSDRQMKEYFDLTMKDALAHGLTSIHDADSSPRVISFFKR